MSVENIKAIFKLATPQEIKDLIRDGEKYHKLKTKEK